MYSLHVAINIHSVFKLIQTESKNVKPAPCGALRKNNRLQKNDTQQQEQANSGILSGDDSSIDSDFEGPSRGVSTRRWRGLGGQIFSPAA